MDLRNEVLCLVDVLPIQLLLHRESHKRPPFPGQKARISNRLAALTAGGAARQQPPQEELEEERCKQRHKG